jgi:hypothetical protein
LERLFVVTGFERGDSAALVMPRIRRPSGRAPPPASTSEPTVSTPGSLVDSAAPALRL